MTVDWILSRDLISMDLFEEDFDQLAWVPSAAPSRQVQVR